MNTIKMFSIYYFYIISSHFSLMSCYSSLVLLSILLVVPIPYFPFSSLYFQFYTMSFCTTDEQAHNLTQSIILYIISEIKSSKGGEPKCFHWKIVLSKTQSGKKWKNFHYNCVNIIYMKHLLTKAHVIYPVIFKWGPIAPFNP